MDKFSAIIPVNSKTQFTDICINSLLIQSYSNFELICADYSNDDLCTDFLNRFAKFDRRIKVLKAHSSGFSDAVNLAVNAAHGDYLTILNQNDWISPVFFEMFLNNIKKCNADYAICNSAIFNQKINKYFVLEFLPQYLMKKLPPENSFSEQEISAYMFLKFNVYPYAKIYKTDFVKNFPITKNSLQYDKSFMLNCYFNARKITFSTECLYYKRTGFENALPKTESLNKLFEFYDEFRLTIMNNNRLEKYNDELTAKEILEAYKYFCKFMNKENFLLLKQKISEMNTKDCNQEILEKRRASRIIKMISLNTFEEFLEIRRQNV